MQHRFHSRAFTLIELLAVITIISILVGIALPVYAAVQLSAHKTQSLSNMRQLGAMLLTYCSDHNEVLPMQGDSTPSWGGAAVNDSTENTAWYNAIPREAGSRGLGDYQNAPALFYSPQSLFFVAAAKYPADKLSAPLFAVAYNSKLFGSFTSGSGNSEDITAIRLTNIQQPSKTCLFQESGLPGETKIFSAQSSYNGQDATFASRSVARYNGSTIIDFADGHAAELSGSQIVDPNSGKAYYPQSLGAVYWTVDPTADANS
jgi:prepilin-type N-terminal cleavage/methylation domain-containing protein